MATPGRIAKPFRRVCARPAANVPFRHRLGWHADRSEPPVPLLAAMEASGGDLQLPDPTVPRRSERHDGGPVRPFRHPGDGDRRQRRRLRAGERSEDRAAARRRRRRPDARARRRLARRAEAQGARPDPRARPPQGPPRLLDRHDHRLAQRQDDPGRCLRHDEDRLHGGRGLRRHRDRLRGGIDLGLDPDRARPRPRQHRLDERGARRQAQDRRPQDRRPRPPRYPARRRPRRRHREGRADRLAWTGYVIDRDQPNDASDALPKTSDPKTLYPAVRESQWKAMGDIAPIRPLTSVHGRKDFRDLTDTVEAMRPRANTNIAIGVAWGLVTLSQSEPFTEAAAFGSGNLKKFMVVLTDGENTQNHIDGKVKSNVGKIDARTRLACQAAKDATVTVYTIRLVSGNAALLRDCASEEKKYFDVQDASQLGPVFQAIAREISSTRLTM